MPANHLIETERIPEHAFLVAVDTGDDDGLVGQRFARRAGQPRDHGRCRGGRRRMAEPPPRRSQLVRRQGQGRGPGGGQAGDRLQHPDRRRRAVAGPAARPGRAAQRQGHRPQPADPRHLRAPRPDPRGTPPGRARPARIPAAAPDAPVDPPLAGPRAASDRAVRASRSSKPTGGSSGPGSPR